MFFFPAFLALALSACVLPVGPLPPCRPFACVRVCSSLQTLVLGTRFFRMRCRFLGRFHDTQPALNFPRRVVCSEARWFVVVFIASSGSRFLTANPGLRGSSPPDRAGPFSRPGKLIFQDSVPVGLGSIDPPPAFFIFNFAVGQIPSLFSLLGTGRLGSVAHSFRPPAVLTAKFLCFLSLSIVFLAARTRDFPWRFDLIYQWSSAFRRCSTDCLCNFS